MQYHHRNEPNPSYPAGESRKPHLRLDFNRRLKLEFHGSKITSDAGLLAYRELDEVLGLTDLGGTVLSALRRGRNTRHLLTGLLRQSVYGRLAGYEDANDAERLSRDPAKRHGQDAPIQVQICLRRLQARYVLHHRRFPG